MCAQYNFVCLQLVDVATGTALVGAAVVLVYLARKIIQWIKGSL